MKSAYKYLAYAIPVLVAVQAAAIAFGFFGLGKWIEDGATLDKAAMESSSTHFTGDAGLMIHGIDGQMVIPAVALILLIVSFFAKIPGGSKWAAFVLIDVVVQVALAFIAFGAPVMGMLHGLNALLLAWLGFTAAHRVSTAVAKAPAAEAAPTMVSGTTPGAPA
jgi:hypothetical protein